MKIFAPFAGIVRYHVEEGEKVSAGDNIATVEATKLEA
ncbi:MAG: acetyl-CoA carboxylase biotin carboxyl carrier protein subunit, partial [Corynebacterium flavescens]|nr:acetyl-CoA carboxylase biotin carboxyl carrier protein subunit [Corynebacterium flavescens]